MEMKWFLGTNQSGISSIIKAKKRPPMISEGGEFGSMSRSYESEEALIKDLLVHSEPCRECGGVIQCSWIGKTGQILKEKCICFHCNHWVEIIEENDFERRRVIVNGSAYWRKDYKNVSRDRESCLGFSGSVFNIKMFTGEVHKTNDLWHSGEIPDRFRQRLPDNATFLK
jgi:hypothetical protein